MQEHLPSRTRGVKINWILIARVVLNEGDQPNVLVHKHAQYQKSPQRPFSYQMAHFVQCASHIFLAATFDVFAREHNAWSDTTDDIAVCVCVVGYKETKKIKIKGFIRVLVHPPTGVSDQNIHFSYQEV